MVVCEKCWYTQITTSEWEKIHGFKPSFADPKMAWMPPPLKDGLLKGPCPLPWNGVD
jgi:hypothetical protein